MIYLFRILFFPLALLRMILIFISTLFFLCTVIIENKLFRKPESYRFWSARYWGRINLAILGFIVKRNKAPKVQDYILMPNHRSYIDIFMAAAYSPSVFVSKAEVAKWPLLGPALKAARAILVQRDNMQSLLETMNKINISVKNGTSVTVFPEGTTFKGPGTLPFKNGTFKIAAENNILIVPCAIEYRDKNMRWISNETFIGHFLKQMWKPISFAEFRFGDPIQHKDFKQLKELTRSSINEMLAKINS